MAVLCPNCHSEAHLKHIAHVPTARWNGRKKPHPGSDPQMPLALYFCEPITPD